MEVASANITHVPYFGRFQTDGWGRLPRGYLAETRKGKPSRRNEPQCIPVIKLRHFPNAGRFQISMRTVGKLTPYRSSTLGVWKTWWDMGSGKRGEQRAMGGH